jgi:hypothetical protein
LKSYFKHREAANDADPGWLRRQRPSLSGGAVQLREIKV